MENMRLISALNISQSWVFFPFLHRNFLQIYSFSFVSKCFYTNLSLSTACNFIKKVYQYITQHILLLNLIKLLFKTWLTISYNAQFTKTSMKKIWPTKHISLFCSVSYNFLMQKFHCSVEEISNTFNDHKQMV